MEIDINKYENKLLTKLLNGSSIREIYPMVDKVVAYQVDDANLIILRIYVNDPEMTSENMYDKELDPHYLVDYHVKNYLPYLGTSKYMKTAFVVIGPDGTIINNYMD